jgi:hypothetical protein
MGREAPLVTGHQIKSHAPGPNLAVISYFQVKGMLDFPSVPLVDLESEQIFEIYKQISKSEEILFFLI